MRTTRLVAMLLIAVLCACGRATGKQRLVRLQGAGASFPAPLYGRWFKAYNAAHPDVQIDYQSVGSGSGVKGVIDGMVDFGASDAAMTREEIGRVQRGVQLLPLTAGSIVLSYNLPGVQGLKLSREAYSAIFLGHVKRWDDPEIAHSNPGVKLPGLPIHVVVRADSSGTSFVMSQHLSAVSPEFASNPGTDKMPNWPAGTRAKGNEGIAANIQSNPGAIGYLEYGFAQTQRLPMAQLENRSGKYVAASTASGQATLREADLSADLIGWSADPTHAEAYPIATYTWLILYRSYPEPAKAEALREFVRYCVHDGQQLAEGLGYIPLPAEIAARVTQAVEHVLVAAKDSP